MPPPEIPVVVAPATVIAEPNGVGEDAKDAASRRIIDERTAPHTTEEQDRSTAGQRHINLKWESTQQTIAIGVTLAVLVNCTYLLVFGAAELQQAAFIFLTNIAFLIIGTYFQRTNHTKIGGVGPHDSGR